MIHIEPRSITLRDGSVDHSVLLVQSGQSIVIPVATASRAIWLALELEKALALSEARVQLSPFNRSA